MSTTTMTDEQTEQSPQEEQPNESAETQLVTARHQALEQKVLLVCPQFGYWRGSYTLPKAKTDTTVDGVTVDKTDVTTPRSKLMTYDHPTYLDEEDGKRKPWKKRLQRIESRQKAIIEEVSEPFPIRGVRIVPKSLANKLYQQLIGLTLNDLQVRHDVAKEAGRIEETETYARRIEEAKIADPNATARTPVFNPDAGAKLDDQSVAYQQYVAANEFAVNLEAILQEIRDNTDTIVFDAVECKIPKQQWAMRAKFYCGNVPVELAGSSGKHDEVTEYDLQLHNDLVRDTTARVVEEAIESMIRGPREQLADALAGLKDVIARDGQVSTKSFRPVERAIAKIRAFEFVANATLLAEMKALEERLDITEPRSLDSVTAANNGFTAALDSMLEEVEDASQAARDLAEFGKEFRGIDLN